MRYYLFKSLRLMSMTAVPVFFGISAVAPEIVDLVFGPQWAAARPILAILGVAMTFRAIILVLNNFLQGIGEARAGFWCTLGGAILLPPAFVLGCHWGVLGVCVAWLVGYPILFGVSVAIAARWGGVEAGRLLMMPVPALAAGTAMIVGVSLLRPWLTGPELLQAACLVLAGAVLYCGIMLLAFRSWAMELVGLAGMMRARR